MGFTGHLVVARSDSPLEQVPLLASVTGPHAPEAAVYSAWLTRTGWQAVEVTAGHWDEDRPGALAELVRWTGAPASAAWVLDSDCAIVTGLAPGGRQWRTALHIATIAGYAEDDPEAVMCPEEMDPEDYVGQLQAQLPHAASDIVAWAAAAGFAEADPALIEARLRSTSDFVEETWDAVLAALGLPTP